jgi:outer membrane protein TolC
MKAFKPSRAAYFLIIGCILCASSLKAQVNLDSCQVKARNNYPLIQQFGLIEQSKELTISNANKAYLPSLDVNLIGGVIAGLPSFAAPGTTPESGSQANLISVVQVNQLIWDGGMTKANKEMITANAEIEKADIEVNLYTLKERVNNLFFGILLIDEQIAQLDLLMESLKRNKERIVVAVMNGTAFKSDIDELQVELINIQQKQVELNHNRQAYLSVLSAMIGEELLAEDVFERPIFTSAIDTLSIQRPELSKFENQRSLLEAQAKLNKAMLMPKIGLLGFGAFLNPGIDFGASKITDAYVAGLSVSWSLSPLYKNGNNKKNTEISLQRIQNQKETFIYNTDLALSQSQQDMEKYKALLENDNQIITLKSNIKEAYITKYDNGVSTMSEMLDKIMDENVAKQNRIMHEIQYLMAAYQYLNKSGN